MVEGIMTMHMLHGACSIVFHCVGVCFRRTYTHCCWDAERMLIKELASRAKKLSIGAGITNVFMVATTVHSTRNGWEFQIELVVA